MIEAREVSSTARGTCAVGSRFKEIWDLVIKDVVPVLSLIGVVIIYFHQRSKIGNLESWPKDANDFMSIFDLEKVKSYSKMGEERAKFDYEKEIIKLEKKYEKKVAERTEDRNKLILDFTKLIIALMRPMVETWYLEYSINELPDGDVKDGMKWLREEIRRLNNDAGVANPLRFLRESHSETTLVSPPEQK